MSDLYQEIANSSLAEAETEERTNETIWLVFNAGESHYAIDSNLVQEVMRNSDCYPLPFVPKYVAGVLNSYGNPFAVVNLETFLTGSQESTETSRFYLVLKNKNSVSFQVSEIQEFHTQSEIVFNELTNSKDSEFFTGTISFDGITAPVLDTDAIIEKIRKDIEAH